MSKHLIKHEIFRFFVRFTVDLNMNQTRIKYFCVACIDIFRIHSLASMHSRDLVNKLWHKHIKEHYAAIRRDEVLQFTATGEN